MTRARARPAASRYSLNMEWMLQVVDEVDDALCALRHTWLGINAEFGAFFGTPITLRALRRPRA